MSVYLYSFCNNVDKDLHKSSFFITLISRAFVLQALLLVAVLPQEPAIYCLSESDDAVITRCFRFPEAVLEHEVALLAPPEHALQVNVRLEHTRSAHPQPLEFRKLHFVIPCHDVEEFQTQRKTCDCFACCSPTERGVNAIRVDGR